MSSLVMDLTGSNKNYAATDLVFKIFKYDQFVDFECTAFVDSIEVYLISSGTNNTLLHVGSDYIIPEDAVASCDNDMSRAILLDSNFNKKLCRGIQMRRGVEEDTTYTILVSYQRLYPNQLRTAFLHNEPFNWTPELAYDIVKSVEELKLITSRVVDNSTMIGGDGLFLEVDPTKTNDDNYFEDEVHDLNVSGGKFLIHPKGGSFYYDSVKVYHPASNSYLILNADYFIIGMDEAKTKAAQYTSPVYKFISVVAPILGEVRVTYHAFGGDPTLDNYREITVGLNNVINYLNDANTLTADTLSSTEVMTSVLERLVRMEDKMRRLEGTPSYGDVTTGKGTLMKLFSEEQGLHWYTIASLYKTTGTSSSGCTADTFKFRLQSSLTHYQFEVAVSVDLRNQVGDKFNVSLISDNYPRGYTPFKEYGKVDQIIYPQLRVIWKDTSPVSGAYLQLGFELKGILEETICIEDMSGHESCWKLVDEIATATTPQEQGVVLPNGEAIWSEGLVDSLQERMLIPFSKGHLVWAGLQPMNRPAEGWQTFTVKDDILIDSNINISKLTKLRVDIEELDGLQFPVDICFNGGTNHLKGHASFTHQDKPAYINAQIYYEDRKPVIRLNYDITAGSDSNQLNIRDLVIF